MESLRQVSRLKAVTGCARRGTEDRTPVHQLPAPNEVPRFCQWRVRDAGLAGPDNSLSLDWPAWAEGEGKGRATSNLQDGDGDRVTSLGSTFPNSQALGDFVH
ncbi:hypothetical protein D8B26_003712 [Coccidioides posadasii str. Silveira]|uniref:Uncharacterized protein n=1 Tax=Coccidioides posadasii RMSCC 3488 TaxID=454284 RepID=A0A0J6IDK8_COCPO|nr:hypothetical protein CPAG_06130 [Coccidioides posadasii RMSCC 3488]QVM09044.1 hypothetical protein D8B26_003712 [Coccidioides posadasii str. Silveira]